MRGIVAAAATAGVALLLWGGVSAPGDTPRTSASRTWTSPAVAP